MYLIPQQAALLVESITVISTTGDINGALTSIIAGMVAERGARKTAVVSEVRRQLRENWIICSGVI